MTARPIKLGALLLPLFLVLFMTSGGRAFAHYVYSSGYLYYSGGDCVWGYSEVSHGNGNGYSKSQIQSKYKAAGGSNCTDTFSRPSGYLKVRQIFLAQLAPGWAYCRDTGWLYNTTTTWTMTVSRTHSGKCGTTNYKTESQLYMLNGSWKGGALVSGSHWL